MDEHGFGLLFVAAEDGTFDGFLTRAAVASVEDSSTPIARVRAKPRYTVSPADTVEKAALVMLANGLVVIPVVDEDRLVGVVSQTEVLRALASGLGIGVEGARFTVRVRPGTDDIYRVFEVLRGHDARLLSVARDPASGERHEVILRIEGDADREQLRRAMEAALTGAADA
jgi:CBS domain-containing protein